MSQKRNRHCIITDQVGDENTLAQQIPSKCSYEDKVSIKLSDSSFEWYLLQNIIIEMTSWLPLG